jgi:hypothetical protein
VGCSSKLRIKEIHFTCDEVQAGRGKWFEEHPEEFYSDGFGHLVQRRQCRIELEVDYVEKCGTETTLSELHFMVCFISISCQETILYIDNILRETYHSNTNNNMAADKRSDDRVTRVQIQGRAITAFA